MYVKIMKILDLNNLERFYGRRPFRFSGRRLTWRHKDEQLEVLDEDPSPLFIFACNIIYVKE